VTDGQAYVPGHPRQPLRFGVWLPFRMLMVVFATAFVGLGLVSAAVGVRFAASPVDGTTRCDWIVTVLGGVLFVALALGCWRVARRVLLVGGSGVTLISFWRTRHWAWSQIGSVGMESVYDDDIGMRYWPRLTLVTGEIVHLRLATSASRHGTSRAARVVSVLRLGLLKSRSTPTNHWAPARRACMKSPTPSCERHDEISR